MPDTIKCLCGETTVKAEGWSQIGTVWICPKCQANPNELKKLTQDSQAVTKVLTQKANDKKKVIVNCYKTYDGKTFETEEKAREHVSKISKLEKLHKAINDPVYFNNNQLSAIVNKYDMIKKVMEAED